MKKVPEAVRKELAALSARSEQDIDFSDLPPTCREDWTGAVRGKFYRPVKQQLTVSIDADVLEWLKGQAKGIGGLKCNPSICDAGKGPPPLSGIT